MVRRLVANLVLVACMTTAASAKGWDPASYAVRLNSFVTTDAFPGSLGSGPDHGLEPSLEAGRSVRLASIYKLGLTGSIGGHAQQDFRKANYHWFGLGSTLRRNKTVFTLDGEFVPLRNKFPSDPEEGGPFHSWTGVAGWRQPLGTRARLRSEYTLDREKFDGLNTDRDAHGRELTALLAFTPRKGTELRAELSVSHDQTVSRKFDKGTHWLGAGVLWTGKPGRADLSARSGVRRYDKAIFGDSNFQRRDQWIEVRARFGRELRPGLMGTLGTSLGDQTSSRADRAFNVRSLTLGLEWTGGGK